DANDGTGHIVFDADGKDVQFNAGATAPVVSADELNLLAGNLPSAPGQAWDGGFDPSHLTGTLTLHLDPVTHASALTYDQFIALIGGDAGHITFV
ncbi:MAG: hypothetical protein QM529_06060, partial [Hydrotalea sp.]|nr:hypothetical protein [Hydrotalea sp.]